MTEFVISEFERLQDTIRQFHNRKVNLQFSDITANNATTKRGLLKSTLLIKDKDSAIMTVMRMLAFTSYIDDDRSYSIPVADFQSSVVFKPQISLTFIETSAAARAAKRQRVRMVCSIRIMNKDVEDVLQSDITAWTNEIKLAFPKAYFFDKGRDKYSYRDKKNGFELIIAGQTEPEVKDLIRNIVTITDKTFNEDLLTKSIYTDKNFSTNRFKMILLKNTKLPRQRPLARVKLQKAELKLYGILEDIILVERFVE